MRHHENEIIRHMPLLGDIGAKLHVCSLTANFRWSELNLSGSLFKVWEILSFLFSSLNYYVQAPVYPERTREFIPEVFMILPKYSDKVSGG